MVKMSSYTEESKVKEEGFHTNHKEKVTGDGVV